MIAERGGSSKTMFGVNQAKIPLWGNVGVTSPGGCHVFFWGRKGPAGTSRFAGPSDGPGNELVPPFEVFHLHCREAA